MGIIIGVALCGVGIVVAVLFAKSAKKTLDDMMSVDPNGARALDFTGTPLPVVKPTTLDGVFNDEHGLRDASLNPFGRQHGNIAHVESDGMLP